MDMLKLTETRYAGRGVRTVGWAVGWACALLVHSCGGAVAPTQHNSETHASHAHDPNRATSPTESSANMGGSRGATPESTQAPNANTDPHEEDMYLGQLLVFIRRAWTVPASTAQGSKVGVEIVIGEDGAIASFNVTDPSPDARVTESVVDLFERFRREHVQVPEPPASLRHQFIGTSLHVVFSAP